MKKTMIILAAVLLAGCGDVGEFSRKEGAEHKTETTPAFTFAPADEAAEEAADTTSSAEESEAETAAETTVGKKKAKTTTKKAEEAAVTTKIPENTQAAGANDTDIAQQTEQPKETLATPTVQPKSEIRNTDETKNEEKEQEEKQEPKVPDFYPGIYQPARFVSQSFEANWENYETLRDGYKAVIMSADELVDYMLPIYPMDFIQERVNFYTNEILGGENFFDNNVLIVNTLAQGSGTEPMVQIDLVEPSDSTIKINYSWKYEEGCAYADVMSVCFLQVTAGKDWLKDKSPEWELTSVRIGNTDVRPV